MPATARADRPKLSCTLLALASAWLLTSPLLGHMGPPRPCVAAGAVLAFTALMLFRRPAQRRGWGVLAVIVSVMLLLLGTSAIPPALLGVIGGVTAAMWRPAGT